MHATHNIRIILAEDHEVYRDGFAGIFSEPCGITLVAEATNGEQLVRLARKHTPDVVLADVRMPEMDGIEATRVMTKELPAIAVIGLSSYEDDWIIGRMLEAGAAGYLSKDSKKEEIKKAICIVAAGGNYYCRKSTRKINLLVSTGQFDLGKKAMIAGFNAIEKQMIQYICEEYTGQQIAAKMKMNFRTVEGYRARILAKMGAKNQAGLALYAMRHGLFVPKGE
jgi:DNA-binding NarL/FixJ family response regulator